MGFRVFLRKKQIPELSPAAAVKVSLFHVHNSAAAEFLLDISSVALASVLWKTR
jgi:hypothetical protein